jgi:hypothetical protein
MGSTIDSSRYEKKFFALPIFCDFRARRHMSKFLSSMESEFAEEFLETLLTAMSFVFLFNIKGFRRNIENFEGKYLFRSRDGHITVSVVFRNGRMEVSEKELSDPHVTLTFKDGRTLLNYLLSPKQDILGSILKQDVVPEGNFNYLYKFAYMAKRLQLMATGHA